MNTMQSKEQVKRSYVQETLCGGCLTCLKAALQVTEAVFFHSGHFKHATAGEKLVWMTKRMAWKSFRCFSFLVLALLMLVHCHGLLRYMNGSEPSLMLLVTPVPVPAMTNQNVCCEKDLLIPGEGSEMLWRHREPISDLEWYKLEWDSTLQHCVFSLGLRLFILLLKENK